MMEFFYYGSEFINTFVKACATFRLACAFPPCIIKRTISADDIEKELGV